MSQHPSKLASPFGEETEALRLERRKADLMANLEKSILGLKAQIDEWADKVKVNPVYELSGFDGMFGIVAKWKIESSILVNLKGGASVKSIVDNQLSCIIGDALDNARSTSATADLYDSAYKTERAKLYNWMKRYL